MWMVFFLVLMIILFISSMFSSTELSFWLCMEMANLMFIYPLLVSMMALKSYMSLLHYIVVAGLSSFKILSGFLKETLKVLVSVGLGMKAGIFPFFNWVMTVYTGCGWFTLYVLAMMGKITLLFLYNLDVMIQEDYFMFFFTLLLCSWALFFWKISLKTFIAYSSVISSVFFLYLTGNLSFNITSKILFMSIFVYGMSFLFFSKLSQNKLLLLEGSVYVFLVLSFPGSLMFLYKVWCVYKVISLPFAFMLGWSLASISEQMYFIMYLMEKLSSGKK